LFELFIDGGLLIKNSGAAPDISSVRQFIAQRQALVDADELTRFSEVETSAHTPVGKNDRDGMGRRAARSYLGSTLGGRAIVCFARLKSSTWIPASGRYCEFEL
jgi:hypothetical protein